MSDSKKLFNECLEEILIEEGYVKEPEVCIYPDCNCPFDMGPDGKCLRGFPKKRREATNDKRE